jgi:hypothetical protein
LLQPAVLARSVAVVLQAADPPSSSQVGMAGDPTSSPVGEDRGGRREQRRGRRGPAPPPLAARRLVAAPPRRLPPPRPARRRPPLRRPPHLGLLRAMGPPRPSPLSPTAPALVEGEGEPPPPRRPPRANGRSLAAAKSRLGSRPAAGWSGCASELRDGADAPW